MGLREVETRLYLRRRKESKLASWLYKRKKRLWKFEPVTY